MEQFITEVRKRKYLWSKEDSKYKNKYLINKGWEEIANICSLPLDDVRKKWRNLRDTFLKELKKKPKLNANGVTDNKDIYKGKWIHFEHMIFLIDSLTPNNNMENSTEIVYTTEDSISFPEIVRNERDPLPQSTSHQHHSYIKTEPKKRRYDNIAERLLSLEEEKLKVMRREEEDENLLYFKSLIPYMRQLTPLQQLKVRNKMGEYLLAEFERTCATSVTNSFPKFTISNVHSQAHVPPNSTSNLYDKEDNINEVKITQYEV